jgi:hypothetical protein
MNLLLDFIGSYKSKFNIQLTYSNVDLKKLVKEVKELFIIPAKSKNIQLEIEFEDHLNEKSIQSYVIKSDKERINIVLI